MQKLFKIPLFFFLIAAFIGLFLRWQFIFPVKGVNYSYVLHAHSHLMFLGWVFNTLFVAYVLQHIEPVRQKIFKHIFYALQVLVFGMLISFPLQGYGLYSIVLSTLHTGLALVFIVLFFNATKHLRSASIWFARVSLLFFTLSSAGPFALGYLMANGQGQSNGYYFSVYFYLHFQYNGFFTLGIFSLFFQLLEAKGVPFNTAKAKTFGRLTALACIPAYALSLLWAKPGLVFNIIGLLAAVMQLIALFLFLKMIRKCRKEILGGFDRASKFFLFVVLLAFVVKLVLQLLSAHPYIAQFAYEVRPLVIAYLHLVLLGVISLFLLVWYMEMKIVNRRWTLVGLYIFLVGFIGSQWCLVFMPWWQSIMGNDALSAPKMIFLFSAFMVLSAFMFYKAAYTGVTDTRDNFQLK